MLNTVAIEKDGREFRFDFDDESDDPEEGATLTGVFENGRRLRPSDIEYSDIPYIEAEKRLIK